MTSTLLKKLLYEYSTNTNNREKGLCLFVSFSFAFSKEEKHYIYKFLDKHTECNSNAVSGFLFQSGLIQERIQWLEERIKELQSTEK